MCGEVKGSRVVGVIVNVRVYIVSIEYIWSLSISHSSN